MSEQYRCSECGHFVEIIDDAICDVCNLGKMQHLRYIRGGDGSHWEGCEEVHLDCKIAQLEAELARLNAERRWIPVSERLPEMYSPVLTIAKKAKYPRVLSRETEEKDKWVWALRQLSGYNVAYIDPKTVTHWMPLPEPPESEAE